MSDVQSLDGLIEALRRLPGVGIKSAQRMAFHLLQRGAIAWLGVHLVVHVAGSVLMTWAGFTLFNALRA